MAIHSKFAIDSEDDTASINLVTDMGATVTIFSFGSGVFTLAERVSSTNLSREDARRLVLDVMQWFLIVLRYIQPFPISNVGTISEEFSRNPINQIQWERIQNGDAVFEGSYDNDTQEVTINDRDEIILSPVDFATFVLFLGRMVKDVGAGSSLNELLLLEGRIRRFLDIPYGGA